jgi:site-specific DNA-methyltransferase (cytosine-N4-specific)
MTTPKNLVAHLSEHRAYTSARGVQVIGDSREILGKLPEGSVDLIVTSPPFALLREKTYGNKDQAEYVDWLVEFGRGAHRVLKETGSFVLDLGGAYQRGRPVRSLYQFRVLLALCDTVGFRLAEEFYWHNPAKLPSPIEWVNKRKIRVKDSVNTVWWLSKSDWPKADVRNVLAPYSERMKKLIADPESFYRPKDRPSGHDISKRFAEDNGGSIPPNLLQIPNTDSNSPYLRACKALARESHPARFPTDLPAFFIKFLTEPGDLVVDIFSGSNTTGRAAEDLERQWIAIEERREYAALSAVRFLDPDDVLVLADVVGRIERSEVVDLTKHMRKADRQPSLFALDGSVASAGELAPKQQVV